MMDNRTPRNQTMVGLPWLDEEPFPLHPYRGDSHSYTPSHSRPLSTPVDIPPARRFSRAELEARRVLRLTPSSTPFQPPPRPSMTPSRWDMALAAMIVLYLTLFIVWGVF